MLRKCGSRRALASRTTRFVMIRIVNQRVRKMVGGRERITTVRAAK